MNEQIVKTNDVLRGKTFFFLSFIYGPWPRNTVKDKSGKQGSGVGACGKGGGHEVPQLSSFYSKWGDGLCPPHYFPSP